MTELPDKPDSETPKTDITQEPVEAKSDDQGKFIPTPARPTLKEREAHRRSKTRLNGTDPALP